MAPHVHCMRPPNESEGSACVQIVRRIVHPWNIAARPDSIKLLLKPARGSLQFAYPELVSGLYLALCNSFGFEVWLTSALWLT